LNYHLQELPWDSHFWEFRTGELQVNAISAAELRECIAKAQADNWHLLYWRVAPDDALSLQAAEGCGLVLIDQKLTYRRVLAESVPAGKVQGIRPTRLFTTALESLAWQSGQFSRFATDTRIAPAMFRRLYSTWLQNALRESGGARVLIYGTETAPQGLLTLEVRNQQAHIGLLAVDAQCRRQGIGRKLLQAAEQQARAQQHEALYVVTQRTNHPARQLYEQNGFELVEEEHIYHIWL
jgi:dTDP-4-amino-4,6-dideoxy-D-galactose acyltransferase